MDLAHLPIGMKWFCWGSLADDQYDNHDGDERENRLVEVIKDIRAIISGTEAAVIAHNPMVTGFADYWPQLTASTSPHARQRLRELVWCFADITAWHNDVYGLEKDIAGGQTCSLPPRCSHGTCAPMSTPI
ncbi:terpene synthase family protein [Actinoallomurus iriomotensis]|uniref:Uncharacterized protein n=1 Tax=Actinoallomurus iriomotensis TaxID=478107 RepID=A0A9W6VY63_9ACTN|nr:terpene synthase family protein [Actinoallomurus iriomotensis]GLY83332.1 hypothetical protein Airi02_012620 [Actinoallomurus iriomotensis]